MDASRRSLHVYGKTQAGTLALTAMRGAMSTSMRQLLILVDGKRSIGDLGKIFAEDTLAASLAQLESQGYIECLKHFPEEPEAPAAAPEPLPPPDPVEPPRAAAPAAPAARAVARVEPKFDAYETPPPAPSAPPPPAPAPSPRAAQAATQEPPAAAAPSEAPESLAKRLYGPAAKRSGAAPDLASPPPRPPPDTAAPRTRPPGDTHATRTRQAGDTQERRTQQRGGDTLAPRTRLPGETLSPRTRAPDDDADSREARSARASGRPRRRSNVAIVVAGTCIIAAYGGYQFAVRQAVADGTTAPVPPPAAPVSTAAPAPHPPAAASTGAGKGAVQKAAATGAEASLPPPAPARPAPESAGGIVNLHVRNQVMPQLPQLAKALGIESGHVVVVLHVNPQGTVERVELVSATPPQVYDQAMQDAFSQWTFDPPGVTGRMTVDVTVKPAGTQ
jgi:TonB family protein